MKVWIVMAEFPSGAEDGSLQQRVYKVCASEEIATQEVEKANLVEYGFFWPSGAMEVIGDK